jgi:integrase
LGETLVPATLTHVDPEFQREWADILKGSKAPKTWKAYVADWRLFEAWCLGRGRGALPATPETVALYLRELRHTHKASTITRKGTAISQAHELAQVANPVKTQIVRDTLRSIRRELGTAPKQKTPALTDDLRRMVTNLPDNLLGVRDRALLLLGFAGAFRRSELVGLDVEDLEWRSEGLVVTLRRSKTDQEGAGQRRGIPFGRNPETCPVRALMAWLETAKVGEGPVFCGVNRHGQRLPGRLTDRQVARVVKRRAAEAGLPAPDALAGHSLRAGLATSAAMAGVSERDIMKQTGHRNVDMARRYIREGELFRGNASASVGL